MKKTIFGALLASALIFGSFGLISCSSDDDGDKKAETVVMTDGTAYAASTISDAEIAKMGITITALGFNKLAAAGTYSIWNGAASITQVNANKFSILSGSNSKPNRIAIQSSISGQNDANAATYTVGTTLPVAEGHTTNLESYMSLNTTAGKKSLSIEYEFIDKAKAEDLIEKNWYLFVTDNTGKVLAVKDLGAVTASVLTETFGTDGVNKISAKMNVTTDSFTSSGNVKVGLMRTDNQGSVLVNKMTVNTVSE